MSDGQCSFVLVHGGAHGAWCWERLVPHLEASPKVEAVVAVDLPGHGANRDVKPIDEIGLDDYADAVVAAIEDADLHEVILVGHSLAGVTLPRAGARVVPRLRRLVFLSTIAPAPGQSVQDAMKHPLSPIQRGLAPDVMFCSDLDAEATAWVLGNLGPQPEGPMTQPVEVATAPPGVPSSYVLLERDEALPPEMQREQARVVEVDEIVPFDGGHDAFVSRPAELAELLLRWA